MSQPHQDEVCNARNCRDLRLTNSVEFCHHHERQLHEFQQWLDGLDADGCPVARSFDFERGTWSETRPSA
jgi:hypothetical protein